MRRGFWLDVLILPMGAMVSEKIYILSTEFCSPGSGLEAVILSLMTRGHRLGSGETKVLDPYAVAHERLRNLINQTGAALITHSSTVTIRRSVLAVTFFSLEGTKTPLTADLY